MKTSASHPRLSAEIVVRTKRNYLYANECEMRAHSV
jgi:hypothetical protein